MLRPLAILLALSGAACGSGDRAFLSSAGLQSLVLVAVDGEVITLEAIDLPTGAVVDRTPPDGATMYALGYASTLAQLGLRAGALAQTPSGGALPLPDRKHLLEGSTWTPIDALPAALTALRLTTAGGCATFDQHARSLPLTGDLPSFAVTLDESRAFVGWQSGRFQMHELDRSYDVGAISPDTPHLGGFVYGGEVWMVGPGTRVVHGHPDRGFEDAPPLPFDVDVDVKMDGAHGDAPFELFVTDGKQGVAHFDGVAWRVLRPTSAAGPDGTDPGIAWMEPGRAVLVGVDVDTVLELSSDGSERRVALMLPPRASRDSVWSAGYVDGRGAVLGTRSSVMFDRTPDGWRQLPQASITPRADSIVSLGRGAFLAGGQGRLAQWRGSSELCEPPLSVPSGISNRASAQLGDGFMLIVDGFEARSVIVGSRVN